MNNHPQLGWRLTNYSLMRIRTTIQSQERSKFLIRFLQPSVRQFAQLPPNQTSRESNQPVHKN